MTTSELKQNKKEWQREYRCLLLGCGEAGKSTFIKQMRIIHGDSFTEEEETEYKIAIAKNILSAIKTLLENMSFQEENEFQSDNALDSAMQNVLYLGYVKHLYSNQRRSSLTIGKMKVKNFSFYCFFREKDVTMDLILSRADDINLLWQSKQIQEVYQRRNNFQIVECAQYFLDRVHTISRNDYKISEQDIIQARIKTVSKYIIIINQL